MLPGDYIAMKLSGEIGITIEGLSEGIFWDFKNNTISEDVIQYFGIAKSFFPEIVPTFGIQAQVSANAAAELGLKEGTPITYRAGDQPNNALSLNVFNPGEIASTAGTSGVVYGVLDQLDYDKKSRVNTFAHVNYSPEQIRLGVLLCINGTGILNSWLKQNFATSLPSYGEMNEVASLSPIGSKGLSVIPFGNGAERVLENKEVNCSLHGINFNTHSKSDVLRAAQEGIVYSYEFGMDIMRNMGMNIQVIRAGNANMFLSSLFRQTLASVTNAQIELYDTDGAAGAARAAGMGVGFYADSKEAFSALEKIAVIEPEYEKREQHLESYHRWKNYLKMVMNAPEVEKSAYQYI